MDHAEWMKIIHSAGLVILRTLYPHIRSLGGPIFSLIGFTLSLQWRRISPYGSLNRDLADASLFGHSVIFFGSFAPVPMIDGGTILKGKLVEAGQTPAQADRTVQKTDLGLGAAFLSLGALLGLLRKRKLVGALLAGCGVVGIAAGLGWLK